LHAMLEAEPPVVIFGNGLGDHLLGLPALRALGALFEGRLALVAMPGMAEIFFQGVRFRSLCETVMRVAPGGRVFDPEAIVQSVTSADLVLSLNPWHSGSVDRLLALWSAPRSLGFHPAFSERLRLDFNVHAADLAFSLARRLNSELRIETFAAPLVVSRRAIGQLRRVCASFPDGAQILTVHADTGLWTSAGAAAYGVHVPPGRLLGNKMWPPERFVKLLDAFLARHPDFIAIVVGGIELGLDRGECGDRVIPACGLPIDVSFALVGRSDLFLGVDSCMLHAADLYRIPSVGLFGPTNPNEFGFRFGPHVHVSATAMDMISVDEVLAGLETMLLSESRSTPGKRQKNAMHEMI